MAKSKSQSKSSSKTKSKSSQSIRRAPRRPTSNGSAKDAIALLKADHRQVEEWFGEFEKANDATRKAAIAQQICEALKVHTQIEEEIFYPAFLEASGDEAMHHEAEVEHHGAKRLIGDIESGTSDGYFDARVMVLSEMIKHHVKEEEQPGGMFAKAQKSDMDLVDIGRQLQARKNELASDGSLPDKAIEIFAYPFEEQRSN